MTQSGHRRDWNPAVQRGLRAPVGAIVWAVQEEISGAAYLIQNNSGLPQGPDGQAVVG